MARRRRSTSFGRRFARRRGGSRSSGLISLVKPAVLGAIVGIASDKFAPQVLPFQGTLAGAGVGAFTSSSKVKGAVAGAVGYQLASRFVVPMMGGTSQGTVLY